MKTVIFKLLIFVLHMALGLIDLTGKRKKKTHLRVKNHFHYAEDFEFNF